MITIILLALLVLLGHVGWWLFCYNRINATALPRPWIKRIELAIIGLIIFIPIAVAWTHGSTIQGNVSNSSTEGYSPWLVLWVGWSLLTVVILGPLWLESRFWLLSPKNLISERVEHVDVSKAVNLKLTGKWISSVLARVPLNEITHLSITHKTIELERSWTSSGSSITIGHLSDLHFTGQLRPEFYHYVVSRMEELQPDLLAITGDIIDKDYCVEWLEPILGRLKAPLGCVFLFGNHEKRLKNIQPVLQRLGGLGWHDLGASDVVLSSPDGPPIILCGNEQPWFERHTGQFWENGPLAAQGADQSLKVALSHSPDQHPWVRSRHGFVIGRSHAWRSSSLAGAGTDHCAEPVRQPFCVGRLSIAADRDARLAWTGRYSTDPLALPARD